MKNTIAIFCGFFLMFQTIKGQNNLKDSAILINCGSYKCTLFQENYKFKFYNQGVSSSYNVNDYVFGGNTDYTIWTPTIIQIKQIESNLDMLFNTLKIDLKNDALNQFHCDGNDIDSIKNNLDNYNKQYVGFIKNGNKYVYINFYYKKMNMDLNSPDLNTIDSLGDGLNLFNVDIDYKEFKIKRIDIKSTM